MEWNRLISLCSNEGISASGFRLVRTCRATFHGDLIWNFIVTVNLSFVESIRRGTTSSGVMGAHLKTVDAAA